MLTLARTCPDLLAVAPGGIDLVEHAHGYGCYDSRKLAIGSTPNSASSR